MTTQLKKIDAKAALLTSRFDAGQITEAAYLGQLRKLTDRAEAILARVG